MCDCKTKTHDSVETRKGSVVLHVHRTRTMDAAERRASIIEAGRAKVKDAAEEVKSQLEDMGAKPQEIASALEAITTDAREDSEALSRTKDASFVPKAKFAGGEFLVQGPGGSATYTDTDANKEIDKIAKDFAKALKSKLDSANITTTGPKWTGYGYSIKVTDKNQQQLAANTVRSMM